jgi:signal transduction histidine kinase
VTKRHSTEDTIPLVLLHRPGDFAQLADALETHKSAIAERHCRVLRTELSDVTQSLTERELLDDLTDILDEMVGVLRGSSQAEERLRLRAPVHGIARFGQGFDLRELVTEYPLLRRVVLRDLRQALGRDLTVEEVEALHGLLDFVSGQTSIAYARQRETALQLEVDATGRFLAGLSHDLRNELNAVSMLLGLVESVSQAALDGVATTPDSELRVAVSAVQRSRRVMKDTLATMERLLESERLHADPSLRQRNISLSSTLQAIAKSAAHQSAAGSPDLESARQQIAAVQARIGVDCPDPSVLLTDPELLGTILLNLAGNAVKFAGDEPIMLRARRGRGVWRIEVADQGPGISSAQRDTMFEQFNRAGRIGGDGVGLGLSIAHRATVLLGGELSVESNEHGGATFVLTLPVLEDADPSDVGTATNAD